MGWLRSTRGDDRVELSPEERLAQIGPGVPGRCPACGGLGYIDDIDIGHRYQIQHCKDCQHRWEYLFDADGGVIGLTELDRDGRPVTRPRIRAERDAPVPPTAPEPEPAADAPVVEVPDDDHNLVIDVREEVATPDGVVDLTAEPAELSPADWLRRSLHH